MNYDSFKTIPTNSTIQQKMIDFLIVVAYNITVVKIK